MAGKGRKGRDGKDKGRKMHGDPNGSEDFGGKMWILSGATWIVSSTKNPGISKEMEQLGVF